MAKKTIEEKVKDKLSKQIGDWIMYTKNNNYNNPLLSVDAKVDDGSCYRLTFERIDLD